VAKVIVDPGKAKKKGRKRRKKKEGVDSSIVGGPKPRFVELTDWGKTTPRPKGEGSDVPLPQIMESKRLEMHVIGVANLGGKERKRL